MNTSGNRVYTFRIKYVIKDSYGIQYYTVVCNETGELHDFTASQIREKVYKYLQNCQVIDGSIITDAHELYVGGDISRAQGRVITGWNDLETWCIKNKRFDILKGFIAGDNGIKPSEVTRRSGKSYKFKCQKILADGQTCGHEWCQLLSNVTTNSGKSQICPKCRARDGSGKHAVQGINDLETWCNQNNRLDILKEYNLACNKDSASIIAAKQHSIVNWKCNICGFEWRAQVSRRTSSGTKCPKCQTIKGRCTNLVVGANDLETWCRENSRQDILDAWDTSQKLRPRDVSAKTDTIYVNVKCSICGKVIETKPYLLTRSPLQTICVNCRSTGTQVPQIILDQVLKKRYQDTQYRYKINSRFEIDEYIPSLRLGIEYNGLWHETDDGFIRDLTKYGLCNELGIKLLTIQESGYKQDIQYCNGIITLWSADNRQAQTYQYILDVIKHMTSIDIDSVTDDEVRKAEEYAYSVIKRDNVPNNITITHPEIAATWDYEKNGSLRPEMFTAGQHKKVFWKCTDCKIPHSYEKDIHHRCRGKKGQGCPLRQGGAAVVPGINDFKSKHPKLIKFWDYYKNDAKGIKPEHLRENQHSFVYWKCPECGYEWYKEVQVFRKLKRCKSCKTPINRS